MKATKMFKGNAVVMFVYADNTVEAVSYVNSKETQRFTYTTAQALAVMASLTAIGYKKADIVEKKAAAPKKDAPKERYTDKLTQKYGDIEARRHFVEVRNAICITAGAYFDKKAKEANKFNPKNVEYKKQKKAFINAWANKVIAAEA